MSDEMDRDAAGVVTAFLAAYGADYANGRVAPLADYQARFPGFEDEVAREYASLQQADEPEAAGSEPPTGGRRYRVDREIARGGMGSIFRIWDQDLDRALAMKRLRSDRGAVPEHALQRFLEEAKVTAQLHHPGVVPVHDLGVDQAGNVYFTMDLVRGRTFGEVIDRVHAGDPEWTRTRALGVVQRICDAVAYAHSKGVVHRDLKPQNVMVGRFGEVYVMDWGLARAATPDAVRQGHDAAGVADGERDVPTAAEDPTASLGASMIVSSRPESSSGSWTIEGDVVGTPAYMAPEQAQGRLDAIGPRADVFAIGAILYHLLASRPPYERPGEALSSRELLDRVVAGPPRPLSEVAPSAPAELAAICEKAMARDPDARYADVRELGEDVRAFLESRVVRAYEAGAFAEARKWIGRNRLAAAALLIATGTLVAGLAASLIEKGRADRQAVRADISAKDAMAAVEQMLARVGQNELVNVPQAEPVRKQLLADALAFYEKFLRDRGEDPSVRSEIARTTIRIAILRHRLGERAAAEVDAERAIVLLADAIDKSDDHDERLALRRLLGLAQDTVAICRMESGRLDDAEQAYREALGTFAALVEAEPDEPHHLEDHARVANNLSVSLSQSDRLEDALAQARTALAARERLVARFGDEYADGVASSANQLGAILEKLRRRPEAIEAFRRAVATYEVTVELPADDSRPRDDWRLRNSLAQALSNLAVVLAGEEHADEAAEALARSIAIRRQLVADFPSIPFLQSGLGISLRVEAKRLRAARRCEAAMPLVEEAIALGRSSVARSPGTVSYATALADHLQEGHYVARALRRHDRMAAFAEHLAELSPDDPVRLATAAARHADAFPFALNDPSLDPAEREQLALRYGRRSVELLRVAVAAGYDDLPRLERWLAPLRARPELQSALAELER